MRNKGSDWMRGGWWLVATLGMCIEGLLGVACDSSDDSSPPGAEAGPDSTTPTGGDAMSPVDGSPRGDATTGDATTGDGALPPDGGTDGGPDSTTPTGSDATSPVDGSPPGDATTGDTAAGDASEPGDAGPEGSACVAYDASGLDEASVTAGFENVWQVYRCYSCHQSASQTVSDAGDGIVLSGNKAGLGDSGTIFPPNLTSDPVTGLGCWSDPQIVNAILNGVDNEGRTLCKPMPKFAQPATNPDGGPKAGYPMDAATAQEIVEYLRSLPVVVNEVPETMCSTGGADAGEQ